MTIDEESCLLDVLDTAGQEEYNAMRDQYMASGEGFLLVYSINSRDSFDEITSFKDQILRVKDAENVPMVICGNKCDLEIDREVSKQEGKDLCKSFGVPFFETSAFARINIEESFFQVVREIRNSGRDQVPVKKPRKKACSIL